MEQVLSKNKMRKIGGIAALGLLGIVGFNQVLVYNEAGNQTHIRTIFGDEKVVTDVGYATKWFGRATAWRQAQTIHFTITRQGYSESQAGDEHNTVSNYRIVFLGNVDGAVEASTRFRLPTGEQFMKIAREYRTPENFVVTALIPAVKETLQSTASLMSADDYFAGARSEFASEFENQLRKGQYITKRKETVQPSVPRPENAPVVDEDETRRSVFVTVKELADNGEPLRKPQQFISMGVDVVEARITDIEPNPMYRDRMVKVQSALAELAVARQGRLKEEEEKLLVTARGQKEVEAKRQETLRDQIEKTTQADTLKRLAIIDAEREREKARIEKETAALVLDKVAIEAKATKTKADAEAYAKESAVKADGLAKEKMATLENINKYWADGMSKAAVSQIVMGGGDGAGTRATQMETMMNLLTIKAAKDLQLDMRVNNGSKN